MLPESVTGLGAKCRAAAQTQLASHNVQRGQQPLKEVNGITWHSGCWGLCGLNSAECLNFSCCCLHYQINTKINIRSVISCPRFTPRQRLAMWCFAKIQLILKWQSFSAESFPHCHYDFCPSVINWAELYNWSHSLMIISLVQYGEWLWSGLAWSFLCLHPITAWHPGL